MQRSRSSVFSLLTDSDEEDVYIDTDILAENINSTLKSAQFEILPYPVLKDAMSKYNWLSAYIYKNNSNDMINILNTVVSNPLFIDKEPNDEIKHKFESLKLLETDIQNTIKYIVSKNVNYSNRYDLLYRHFQAIPEHFMNRINYSYNFNALFNLYKQLTQLDFINCSNKKVTSIPKGLVKLKTLDCSYNHNLHTLPDDMIGLELLTCNHCNSLDELPSTLINLEYIDCEYSGITQIPSTFDKLCYLKIENTGIVSLPDNILKIFDHNITLETPPKPKKKRKIKIDEESNLTSETFSSDEYDRTIPDDITYALVKTGKLSPRTIYHELNQLKAEMPVHSKSRQHTRFHNNF